MAPRIDPESLEQENDRGIEALSERTNLLRQITHGIKAEVDSQHSMLDNMADSMGSTRLGLGSAVDRFKKVMEEPQQRKMFLMVMGVVFTLFILYLVLKRR